MDPPSKGKPPHLFKHYKDIKLLTNRDTSSLFLYRQWLFLEKCLSPYVGISHLLRGLRIFITPNCDLYLYEYLFERWRGRILLRVTPAFARCAGAWVDGSVCVA